MQSLIDENFVELAEFTTANYTRKASMCSSVNSQKTLLFSEGKEESVLSSPFKALIGRSTA
jgi:hypothetical protein